MARVYVRPPNHRDEFDRAVLHRKLIDSTTWSEEVVGYGLFSNIRPTVCPINVDSIQ